jgi:hypothetical protein
MRKRKGENNLTVIFYSFKSKGYNILMQAIIDHHKRFQAVFVGVLGTMNDVQILLIYYLYH